MPLSGGEIRRNLAEFAAEWGGYHGSERGEAQTFLNDLLECFGTDRKAVGARFEEHGPGGFMDMIWPGVCIVEMKRPGEAAKLEEHRKQALDYWLSSGTPESPAPHWVVLCAFHRFEIWEPGALFGEPRAVVDLAELPDRLDTLLFLAGRQPVFVGSQAELTREAAAKVTDMLASLQERRAADPEVLRDFALQSVWCMFAEDLQLLPSHLFTQLVDGLLHDPNRSSEHDLGSLFRYLNEEHRPRHGMYAGLPYVNGALFEEPAAVDLLRGELELLRAASDSPWHRVEPAIFGSLLEGALGRERQWSLGAHYTAEADILKVVLPTVVEPWRERIATCDTLADAESARSDLMKYVVLDPACGSGNFLYVAYRELRRIEAELRARIEALRREAGLPEQGSIAFFPLTNMLGIELEPFAVKLARVTLWMGHKLAVDELGLDEKVLPLADLSGIRRADALRVPWPRADAIVGNPPYHGSQRIRRELGDDYAERLIEDFGVGLKDYAVYWFRKAHERLEADGRAGLVATNSISQNRSRGPSLDWILANDGVITDAVSSQPWSGAAKVHVSIVNWIKSPASPPGRRRLDSHEVDAISSALKAEHARPVPTPLAGNRGMSFQGVIPAGMGFIIGEAEADDLLADPEIDYGPIVRRYLMGEDIADDVRQTPTRWIIDFGTHSLEAAMQWPRALDIVRSRVRPDRLTNRDRGFRERWWQFGRARGEMRSQIDGLSRYLAANRVGKRLFFVWADPAWCPGDKIVVFALEDDASHGVLSSSLHRSWAWTFSSTLKADLNYTPTSAFETFPWPQPTPKQREAIAEASRLVIARRQEICAEREIGLTKLYNDVDDGAYADLKRLHELLDEAVAAAYGWPKSAAHDPAESNRRLLELNREIAAGRVAYRPFS